MIELSVGALDAIIAGEKIENPIFQILGHEKLVNAVSSECYQLRLSDGQRIHSCTMLHMNLNRMISTELTDFTVVQINRYDVVSFNHAGELKKFLVIFSLDVKRPGSEVGGKIANPIELKASPENAESAPAASQAKPAVAPLSTPATNATQKKSLKELVSAGSEIAVTPIAALSPYRNRWVIKARVSNKSLIRRWSNSRGEGKLFSMNLVDESGEIRCTAFREQCDTFFGMIEPGEVYYVSRCTVKPAKMQFTNLKNDYEITFNSDTEIVACHDDVGDIPEISYDFKPLSIVETSANNDLIDVLAIVKSCKDVQTLTTRNTGRECRKRDIQLVDMSICQVTLTLWGTQAEEFQADGDKCQVLAAKALRVGEFQGEKNLSMFNTSMLVLDPNLPVARRLRDWYNTIGKDQKFKVLRANFGGGGNGGINSPMMTVIEGTRKSLELTDRAEPFVVKAFPSLIRKENLLYKSCPSCYKKLVDLPNKMYKCEKCNREYPYFKYRLLARINISDWTGNLWVTAFNDEAKKLLGVTAKELGELKESNSKAFDNVFTNASLKSHFFKIRMRLETWNGESKLKPIVAAVGPVDRKMYRGHLMQEFKRLTNVETN